MDFPLSRVLACLLFSLFLTVAQAGGVTVEGHIVSNALLRDTGLLDPDTRIFLDGGQKVAYVAEDGHFMFSNVPQGSHVLTVHSLQYVFDKIRVDVKGGTVQYSLTLPGTSWSRRGPVTPAPLAMAPRMPQQYFVPREQFSMLSLLGNPMLLMSGFSMLIFFVMPKLMSAVDPEVLKEATEAAQNPGARRGGGAGSAADDELPQLPQLPDISQTLADWFSGTGTPPATAKKGAAKSR
ncbi:hypothetical protein CAUPRSCDRAFT_12015 [Caulochytrium protostelioides]|uniref:ER membrane protein complex subunit 7 beta-sandwich domain-containing protein n=1 Tax=Caulochytrium protostelioides TaxID=1555241 RepID=A0A4P9WUN3_9FUNG|nr:hypothetical protein CAUPRSCDRAFT_12015 [Caulochytrium protostelioides]